MAPDTHTPPPVGPASPGFEGALDRCPQCRGLVRPDAPWCTQCWTDLRPAPPEPEPAPEPASEPASPVSPLAADDAPATPVARGLGGWPCSACGEVNAVELDSCAGCGTGFLAGARGSDLSLVVPGLGDLTKVSRAQRLGYAAGVVLAFMVLVLLLGLLG